MTEASDNALRALLILALIPVVVVLARRVLGHQPFHLTPAEHANYRLLSLGTVGSLMALAGLSVIPTPIAAVTAGWVAFAGLRIGSRLHLATPLQARLAFERVEILDKFNARVECGNGRSLHPLPYRVVSFLDDVASRGRVVTRSQAKSLPALFTRHLKDRGVSRAERRDARQELDDFLHQAPECGCLVLEPIPEPAPDTAAAPGGTGQGAGGPAERTDSAED